MPKMLILTIRTDKPESEIGLYIDEAQQAYEVWEAHRKLAETIHNKIDSFLSAHSQSLSDIEGIVIYKGPGSFTGLRIGISVANTLAYSLKIPIVGESKDWIERGIDRLKTGLNDKTVAPEYGHPVHITQPKK